MTIVGNRAVIKRSSDPATPPFRLFFVDTAGDLTLQDLTIRNGQARSGSPGLRGPDRVLCRGGAGAQGGGIFNRGTLTLTNSALRGNSAGAGGRGSTFCRQRQLRRYPQAATEASEARAAGSSVGES